MEIQYTQMIDLMKELVESIMRGEAIGKVVGINQFRVH